MTAVQRLPPVASVSFPTSQLREWVYQSAAAREGEHRAQSRSSFWSWPAPKKTERLHQNLAENGRIWVRKILPVHFCLEAFSAAFSAATGSASGAMSAMEVRSTTLFPATLKASADT